MKAVFGNSEGKAGKGKKAAKEKPYTEILLFDLSNDISEANNLAASRPEDVARIKKLYIERKKDFPTPTWGGKNSKAG